MELKSILNFLIRFAAITVAIQTGTIWVCSSWFWTPIQRHYLPAYIWCSLPVITPATAEVRFIWKTGRHRKRELASDDDAISFDGEAGMTLSQRAIHAGWRTLKEDVPRQVPAALLRLSLADLAFDGESLWSFLLLPEVCGAVIFCYGVYGSLRLLSWLLDWAVERSIERHRT